jgi:hypothetical protein
VSVCKVLRRKKEFDSFSSVRKYSQFFTVVMVSQFLQGSKKLKRQKKNSCSDITSNKSYSTQYLFYFRPNFSNHVFYITYAISETFF